MFNLQQRFAMDTDQEDVKNACNKQLMKHAKNQLHYLKKVFFDPFPINQVRKTSPVEHMSDEAWCDLVDGWSDPKKQVISFSQNFAPFSTA